MGTAQTKFKKSENTLIYLCVFMYVMMMAAKNIFTAEIVEIIDVFNTTASKASLANLYYYTTYALMQFLIILFINKVNLKIYLGITVSVSALISIAIGVVGHMGAGIGFIFVMFTINGFMQAGIYGCSVKLFAKYLSREGYYKGINYILSGQVFATIFSYGLSAIFVALGRWEAPFIIIGCAFLLSAILFVALISKTINNLNELNYKPEAEKQCVKQEKKEIALSSATKKHLIFMLVLVCAEGFLAPAIHYGINNWFSKLLYDVYNFPKVYSILVSVAITVALTLVSVLSVNFYSKRKKVYKFSIIGFIGAVVFAVALVFLFNAGIIISTILCLAFLAFNTFAKAPYGSVTAYELKEVIDPGRYSLLHNAFVSIAAGCAPTILSLIFENFGWATSYITVAVVCLVLIILVIMISQTHKKLFKSVEEKTI